VSPALCKSTFYITRSKMKKQPPRQSTYIGDANGAVINKAFATTLRWRYCLVKITSVLQDTMYFSVLFVLIFVSGYNCHPGEPQTWLATVSELLEKMIKTEIRVQTMQEEVNAGLKTISAMTETINTLQTACNGLVNKTGRLSICICMICS